MTNEHRHTDASRGDFDAAVDNLLSLGNHLPLFFGVAAIKELVDVRDHVEGDLFGELPCWLVISGVVDRLGLIPQLINAAFACTRN